MKVKNNFQRRQLSGYAILMVMVLSGISLLVLSASLSRTTTVSKLNDRSNELLMCQNAAEAAVEAVFARMQYDFQTTGPATVTNSLGSANYRYYIPATSDEPYWANFQFSDGQGNNNRTYVSQTTTYTGQLPQAYPGRSTANAPVYRILSNARLVSGSGVVGTAQQDVMLALVPLTAYAIFYNDLLEFSTCASMDVNGPVHSNTNIYVGAGSGATLRFNTTVTASGTITAPRNNNTTWTGPTNYNSANWRTYFNGSPSNFISKVPTVQIPIPMTNSYSLIEKPPTNDYTTSLGQQRLYNKATVIVLVSNTSVTTIIQKPPSAGAMAAADGSKTITTYTNLVTASLLTNLPFLNITNRFYDRRESKTNLVTQIDLARYSQWLTNSSQITSKFITANNEYPTILYVLDGRTNIGYLPVVRLTNGISLPVNGGLGFTLATANPLYVWGHYNCPNTAYLGNTNTVAAGTVPSALMADALTILSPAWRDSQSTASYTSREAANTTVNAAILTGVTPSTGPGTWEFGGGVHNLPRLLEDWLNVSPSRRTLTLNTSIINLFTSRRATNQFINPGNTVGTGSAYYDPPYRDFSYDQKFRDPTQTPPGMPNALVALRYGWATPPPNTLTYNVTP
ncbi:MAG: hypothetical protein H7Y43_04600 [Akkermansiaceae bacterium]|nr:hypothetical protein [Verrucomicrobiales bacterium]